MNVSAWDEFRDVSVTQCELPPVTPSALLATQATEKIDSLFDGIDFSLVERASVLVLNMDDNSSRVVSGEVSPPLRLVLQAVEHGFRR